MMDSGQLVGRRFGGRMQQLQQQHASSALGCCVLVRPAKLTGTWKASYAKHWPYDPPSIPASQRTDCVRRTIALVEPAGTGARNKHVNLSREARIYLVLMVLVKIADKPPAEYGVSNRDKVLQARCLSSPSNEHLNTSAGRTKTRVQRTQGPLTHLDGQLLVNAKPASQPLKGIGLLRYSDATASLEHAGKFCGLPRRTARYLDWQWRGRRWQVLFGSATGRRVPPPQAAPR